MTATDFVGTTDLRARFAFRLGQLYGSEVPAYNTLVDIAREVNADIIAARGHDAERLGDIDRVTAERHGAIRVGSPRELAQVAHVFAAFGMHPVGFYDLRNGDGTGVPVVSTAFRPISSRELARNPFRVFTSMLAADDSRFFDADTQAQLGRFIEGRQLFSPELLELAARAASEGGLNGSDAADLLAHATESFRLSRAPIDQVWYDHLASISSVAADIGGVAATHINHLTPRVLSIGELYQRMQDRGIEMIEAIQGPPAWTGPDVLLRQTSFRALDERRWFRQRDGTLFLGALRVRFGEVEQRGIALTPSGMKVYEQALATVAQDARGLDQPARQRIAERVWSESYPSTEIGLAERGLAWFTHKVIDGNRSRAGAPGPEVRLTQLMADGLVTSEAIVYEDFLPRSAAGIFRSNLSGDGFRDDSRRSAEYDLDRLAGIVHMDVADPQELYRSQRQQSIDDAEFQLSCTIIDDLPICQ